MENTNAMSGLKGLRYAPVALGCLMAMLTAPAYAWQDVKQDTKAALTGQFEGSLPVLWEHKVADVKLNDLNVTGFSQVAQSNKYTATLTNGATPVHVFSMIQKEAARHKAITPMKVEYLDKDATVLIPAWIDANKKMELEFKGEISTPNGTVVPLTVRTQFQGGAGAYLAKDVQISTNSFCLKDGIMTSYSYINHMFAGLLAPMNQPQFNAANHKLIGSVFTKDEVYRRFNDVSNRTVNECTGSGRDIFDFTKGKFGVTISDDLIIEDIHLNEYKNNNSKSVLFTALSLPANESVRITTNGMPKPGTWSAPLTIRLTSM